jgi:putative membrane protein
VAFLVGAYIYTVRVIGPRVRPGQPAVTGHQIAFFTAGMALLWGASDWPMHDIGERYLYSAHMLQHMMLSYFMPPLMLLATPEWMARLLIGDGRVYRITRWLTKPVVAGLAFNGLVMVTHVPAVVNHSVASAPLHYSLHASVVVLSLLMWMPVCGPLPEVRLKWGGMMIYLFAQSIVPTVPAGWLTFADGVVYRAYDKPYRMWGLSVTYDQQIAGVIMKIGGSVFIWTITTIIFFKNFMGNWERDHSGAQRDRYVMPGEGGTTEPALVYADVAEAFERTVPVVEGVVESA